MAEHWSDSEITSATDDKLDREDYALLVAKLIAENHSPDASIVYGMAGPWGSGKSSLVNMISEKLQVVSSTWAVARFTPWATSDVSGLLGDFYASLAGALPNTDTAKAVRSTLASMMRIASPLAGLLPIGGSLVEKTVDTAAATLAKQRPWKELFDEASEKLSKLEQQTLVVVDDIDRLQADELLTLLKVIRLLGRFPGVDYLLAYDEDSLVGTLTGAGVTGGGTDASRFMEKIVQYPLVVPPLLPYQIESRLRDGIREILTQLGRPGPEEQRCDRLIDLLASHLTTPRAIARWLAQVELHLPALDTAEVDDCDVLAVTLLRMLYSTLYLKLPNLRYELTSGNTGDVSWDGVQPTYARFDPTTILNTVPEASRPGARQILGLLFPRLTAGDKPVGETIVRKGVGDPAYFDRYFALRVPAHDIADGKVTAAVDAAAVGDNSALRELVLNQTDTTRAELAVRKAIALETEVQKDPDNINRCLGLTSALIPIMEELSPHSRSVDSMRTLVRRWANEVLLRLSGSTAVNDVLAALHSATTAATILEILGDPSNRMTDQPWFSAVLDKVETRAVREVIDHLKARDNASLAERPRFVMRRLDMWDRGNALEAEIADGLRDGSFTLDDVAARCVVLGWTSTVASDSAVILEFDVPLFYRYAEQDAMWLSESLQNVSRADTSWENLRRYAAGCGPR